MIQWAFYMNLLLESHLLFLLGKGDKKMLSIFWSFAKPGMGVSGVVRKPNCFLEKYLLRNYLEPILENIALKLARLSQSKKKN